jgi:hypothetical protein
MATLLTLTFMLLPASWGCPPLSAQNLTHQYVPEWIVRYDTTAFTSLPTTIPDSLYYSLGDSVVDSENPLPPMYPEMFFMVRIEATYSGVVRDVKIMPLHVQSRPEPTHRSWAIAKQVIGDMIRASRLHSIREPGYAGPVTMQFLQDYSRNDHVYTTPELASMAADSLNYEYMILARIGEGVRYVSTDMLNIGYFHTQKQK